LELGNTGVTVRTQPDPLTPGCSYLTNQTVYYQDLPEDINVSAVKGGDCIDAEGAGNYSYQWQWSTDNAFFQDIPNTNVQNLHFTNDMYFANHQSPGTTIYVQRKTTCGAEVQYTNSSSITYTGTPPLYARLELELADSTYDSGDDYESYAKEVNIYIRFYSDKACTIRYQLPANVNFHVKSCLYYEINGAMISNNCSTYPYYYAYAGSSETFVDNLHFEEYYLDTRGWNTYKYIYDYELVSAGSYIIKPTAAPPHTLMRGGN
jgi:hypothetical protein